MGKVGIFPPGAFFVGLIPLIPVVVTINQLSFDDCCGDCLASALCSGSTNAGYHKLPSTPEQTVKVY